MQTMIAEASAANNLLVIELNAAELERLDARSLNDRIRQSMAPAVLIYPHGEAPAISIEKALSRFRPGCTIKMIVFSGGAWPLLFTQSAWNDLRGFQGEEQGAEKIVSHFLAQARKARLFTVMQIGK